MTFCLTLHTCASSSKVQELIFALNLFSEGTGLVCFDPLRECVKAGNYFITSSITISKFLNYMLKYFSFEGN